MASFVLNIHKLKIPCLISTCVFLQLSIVDPSIVKWCLTVHYVVPEDILKFQYGRRRISDLKMASFVLNIIHKLKIPCLISTCVFLQLSIVDPSILKWCLTVHYVVPEDILKFQYGRRRISYVKMASFVLNIHKLKIPCLISTCVFLQLSIVDPSILKWCLTVHYVVPEDILKFQYGRRRISDVKMASFVLNIHKLKIPCLISTCVFLQLSIVDPSILKWCPTVHYVVPEDILKFQYGRRRISDVKMASFVLNIHKLKIPCLISTCVFLQLSIVDPSIVKWCLTVHYVVPEDILQFQYGMRTISDLKMASFVLNIIHKLKIPCLISTCVFLQLSIVDPSILKWCLTVHYVVPEDILQFQYGRRRISDVKMASFVLNIHKLKIPCLISTCVFLQLSIVDPSIHKWCLTVHYVVPEDILKFQYGRRRISDVKMASFVLNIHKLKIPCLISTCVFLQLSIVDPSILKWCPTVHYVVPEDILKFQYGRRRISDVKMASFVLNIHKLKIPCLISTCVFLQLSIVDPSIVKWCLTVHYVVPEDILKFQYGREGFLMLKWRLSS